MINRRVFMTAMGSIAGALAARKALSGTNGDKSISGLRKPDPGSFDPWVEVIADAIRNNVKEIYRYTKGCRLLAVAKNNANGIGLRQVGPILDQMDEVFGIAIVRIDEALTLIDAGVKKPIIMMAPVCDAEAEVLVRKGVRLCPFHDSSKKQLEKLAISLNKPIPVHLFVDTGMNREGMPYDRALPWIEDIAGSKAVKIEGTCTMFSGAERDGAEFDKEHLRRFMELIKKMKEKGIDPGLLHGAPSSQITSIPETHKLDLVRPGGAIYGMANYRNDPDGNPIMDIQPVFRLRARVARVERMQKGEGVSFYHRYIAERPTWIAMIPTGHTDGYPKDAAGNCKVMIGDKLYPVIGIISSNHTIVEVGQEKTVSIGDIATLTGPDHPDISPIAVATQAGIERDYWIMTKLNALLHRRVV
ncbi:alanine racemase [Acidobacteriota bacterium]